MKLQSNLVSLPGIHTYLRTSRQTFNKRISMAQARFQRQSGHANAATGLVTMIQIIRKLSFFFSHVLCGRIPMKLPSHVVPFLGNRTYLHTSREAFGKRISVAHARFQRQSGHANGARVTVILLRYYRESKRFLFCFWRRHAYIGQTVWCYCQVFTRICVQPDRPWSRGFQWHRHDLKGRTGMSFGR